MTSVASIFLSHMDFETLNGPKAREHRPTATRARDIRWAREQLLGQDGVSILVLLHQLVLARDGHLEGARRRGRARQITLDSSFVRVIDIVLGNDGAFGQDGAKHGLEGERMTTYLMCLHDSEQASDRKGKKVPNIHLEALILDWSGLCPNPLNKSTSPASKWPDTEAHSRRT